MHICAALIYDTGNGEQHALPLHRLKQLSGERLAEFPLFRRKLHRGAMGMDEPGPPAVENAPDSRLV